MHNFLHRRSQVKNGSEPVFDHQFGSSPTLSVILEEELLLVDDRCRLAPSAVSVAGALPARARKHVTATPFAAQVKIGSGTCRRADEAITQLSETRRQVVSKGFRLLGAGLHPRGGFTDAPIVPNPRHRIVLEEVRSLLRTPPCALHIHVAVPDPATAVRVANGLRRHIPMLQAATANSPYWHGHDSGMASARAAILRRCPRVWMPRAFEDYEDFCATLAEAVAATAVEDHTQIWWDVRPHLELGTVEVRAIDAQPSIARSAAIGALVQALVAREIEEPTPPLLPREALDECHQHAAQHGFAARVCRVDGSTAPAAEVLAETLLEALPYMRELGTEGALDVLEAIAKAGNGADEQRRIHGSLGMHGLLNHLGRRTEALV